MYIIKFFFVFEFIVLEKIFWNKIEVIYGSFNELKYIFIGVKKNNVFF